MFVRPKMGYVRAKIGLTGQFDRHQPGNYLKPCISCKISREDRLSLFTVEAVVLPLQKETATKRDAAHKIENVEFLDSSLRRAHPKQTFLK